METGNLQIRQISSEAFEWYRQYLECIDAKNIKSFGHFLSDDCVMVQNNQPQVRGKQQILEQLADYWQTFRSLTHELLNIYGQDNSFALEAWNHYVRLGGKKVSIRAVALTDRNYEGLVTSFYFYTDVSPVFEQS